MSKTPDVSPFGPELQKYWDKRYLFFSRFDDGIQIDQEGLYSVIPEDVGLRQAELMQGQTVLDGFGGVGGSAIAFARAGKQVTCIEIDPGRLKMIRNNAEVYGVADKILLIEGDFLKIAPTIKADTVNLDPPWGGPAYKELGRFLLEHFSPDGNALLTLSLAHFREVILRVPTIFDFTELDRLGVEYHAVDDISGGRVISKTVVVRK